MALRLTVDDDRCQGHALCAAAAPDLVSLADDDGHAHVEGEAVPASLEPAARRAVVGCPEGALHVEEIR
jgi:ferredoxin